MRALFLIPVAALAAACAPAVPDSGQGVGFNTPEYQARREAALAGQTIHGDPLIPPAAVSSETLPPSAGAQTAQDVVATPRAPQGGGTAEDIARETAFALEQAQANSGVAPVQASPSNPAPVRPNNTGISDEQDFAAVSNRQSIESDAERIARIRAQRQEVAAVPVPERSTDAGPNIVQYALSTSHPRGTRVYSRAGLNLEAKAQRNCAGFSSSDQAQIAFLANGGPQRDRKGLDPDGDGYACGWDPAPFRRAVKN